MPPARRSCSFSPGRPGFGRGRPRNSGAANPNAPVPDANPGTFYSALANIDIEIRDGNSGAVAVRARYAQHCFLAHMDFRLGPALAAVHGAGNVAEDIRCFGGRYAIWTSKPSPGWQFTVIDCLFEGQREAADYRTRSRPHADPSPVPASAHCRRHRAWLCRRTLGQGRPARRVSGPAFMFGVENNPRNEINVEGAACRAVPVFAALRESGKRFVAPPVAGERARFIGHYVVEKFSHGLHYADIGAAPQIAASFDAHPCPALPPPVPSDLPALPAGDTWVNLRDLGAKGDGVTDDTEALQNAIANHPAIYIPLGFYIVRDTLTLRPDTVLIGLHPGRDATHPPRWHPRLSGHRQSQGVARGAQRRPQPRPRDWPLHQRQQPARCRRPLEGRSRTR